MAKLHLFMQIIRISFTYFTHPLFPELDDSEAQLMLNSESCGKRPRHQVVANDNRANPPPVERAMHPVQSVCRQPQVHYTTIIQILLYSKFGHHQLLTRFGLVGRLDL